MTKLASVLAAVLVIGSTSLALADDPAIDQAADALRNYGPVVHQQTLTTRPVALPRHSVQNNESSWMERASQSFGGGY